MTIDPIWAFSARPVPVTAALTSVGVWKWTGIPRLAAASRAMAVACAVVMTEATLTSAKTRSIATTSGSNLVSQLSSSCSR